MTNTNTEIWFPDDIFGVIKEFAGIYSISTEWYKVGTLRRRYLWDIVHRVENQEIPYSGLNNFSVGEHLMILGQHTRDGKMKKKHWKRMAKWFEKPSRIYDRDVAKMVAICCGEDFKERKY